MATIRKPPHRSSLEVCKAKCRCSICGTIIKTPQEKLTIDAKQYCAVCYQDNFFANARSSHRLTLDRCDG